MGTSDTPRSYEEWRTAPSDRAQDAAHTFGYHLIQHCRAKAMKSMDAAPEPKTAEEFRTQAAAAVDMALHNVTDLLEGFWPTDAGPRHRVRCALSVCITGTSGTEAERIDISPRLLDPPIGYWKWKAGDFR